MEYTDLELRKNRSIAGKSRPRPDDEKTKNEGELPGDSAAPELLVGTKERSWPGSHKSPLTTFGSPLVAWQT